MVSKVLPIVYAGNITYFRHLTSGSIILDQYEHFVKRSYRNRATILGPNGRQNLIIPVHWDNRTPMIDVTIDNSQNWQDNHWRSIDAAYGSSPFFIHYSPLLQPLYSKQYESLVEFDMAMQKTLLKCLSTTVDVTLSQAYVENDGYEDLRDEFRPSTEKPLKHKEYIQVFSDRFDFHPNLSILDAIFNLGPEAQSLLYLES